MGSNSATFLSVIQKLAADNSRNRSDLTAQNIVNPREAVSDLRR